VLPGVLGEARSAAVCDLPGGLEEHQAVIRIDRVDAPCLSLTGEGEIVLFGIVAEERQTKAALALERAVAGTGVATRTAEEAHQVPLEVHRGSGGRRDVGSRRTGRGRGEVCNVGAGKKEQSAQRDPNATAGNMHTANLQVVRTSPSRERAEGRRQV